MILLLAYGGRGFSDHELLDEGLSILHIPIHEFSRGDSQPL